MSLACILAMLFVWSPVVEPSLVLAQATTAITHTTGSGDLGTKVTTHGHTTEITSGSRPGNGTNLFHSFDQFSVGTLDTAKFLNTTPSLQTHNILGRVTGNNPSSIFGTIDTMSYPGANLFLMNPAGIVFGPSATLQVGGSVAFTTANYIRLADAIGSNAGVFRADTTAMSLLTSASVAAFGFLGQNPATAIAVQGSTLTVQPGQSIALVGGEQGFDPKTGNAISIPGGVTIAGGSLSAAGGRITIAGVASPGEILAGTLESTSNINVQSPSTLGRVHISESSINTNGNGNGTILIRGGRLVIDASTIYSDTGTITLDSRSIQIMNTSEIATSTATAGASGHIHLQASGHIDIESSSLIYTTTDTSRQAGNIIVHSGHGNVNLSGGSQVESATGPNSSGNTGSIKIEAPHGDIRLVDSSIIFNTTFGVGTLGGVQVNGHNLRLETSSSIGGDNNSIGTQKPEDIQITLDGRLSVTGGSFINATAFTSPDSANLIIRAPEVFITGKNSLRGSSLFDNTLSSGNAGRLSLFTDNLQLTDGGRLFSKSSIGADKAIPSGHGGDVSIEGYHNPGTLVMIDGSVSGIFTNAEGTGAAGNISVKASSLTLQNGGKMSAETTGTSSTATGGSIIVTATEQMNLTNGASITASTGGPGNAGNILVKANDIAVSGGSSVTASSTGTGNAGTVTIQGLQSSAHSLLIDGVDSGIFTRTSNTGTGGEIAVSANSVRMLNQSSISGETSGTTATASGGKIRVEGDTIRIENGALIKSSSTGAGSGGNIKLTAGQSVSVFDGASISASSTGTGAAGNIEIDAGLELDIQRGSITTQSTELSGGNIDIRAIDLLRVRDGKISTSAINGGGNGGAITIDPKVVLLQNSDILAQANRGNGGDIAITTPVFVADQSSRVDASTPFGLNGRITIQSPTSNLSGTVGQLVSKPSPPQVLLQNRCVALAGGEQSTFLLAGRETLPIEPSGWLTSQVSMEHWTGEEAAHASRLMMRNRELNSSPFTTEQTSQLLVLSLRRLTPPEFLVRTFATEVTGCPS